MPMQRGKQILGNISKETVGRNRIPLFPGIGGLKVGLEFSFYLVRMALWYNYLYYMQE